MIFKQFFDEISSTYTYLLSSGKGREALIIDPVLGNGTAAISIRGIQLAEVEKFFNWYNKIKTMNELDKNNYWKRTHRHIYNVKERLINIANSIKELDQ